MKTPFRRPFFVVNPKAYLFGEETYKLAEAADKLAVQYDLDVFYTAQLTDLPEIIRRAPHLIPTAQHMDGLRPGRGMGHVLPEALQAAGVRATFLNHAEKPMTASELVYAAARANETDILTIFCADTVEETMLLAHLEPDIMICEPTSLIGTGRVSSLEYMRETNEAVRRVTPHTKVLQAAGISTGENVYDAIVKAGADGTGATSGIVAAADPYKALSDMLSALARARDTIMKERKEV
jgi:triosephosphate isomerase